MEQGEIAHLVIESTRIAKEKGFHENFNLKEKLFLLISELSEAMEADRNSEHAMLDEYKEANEDPLLDFNSESYVYYIKDTFEAELAGTFIRLGHICGYLNQMPVIIDKFYLENKRTFAEACFDLCPAILMIHVDRVNLNTNLSVIFTSLVQICNQFGVANIQEYIDLELKFFESRPFKHNKKY